jgi:parallel beta-helix repeat protein
VTVSYPTHGGTNWDSALKNYIDDVKADRTARTQHAPAFGLYFPEAEGAVFDGSSDDHTPIQNAFNAAAAAGAGNTVQFPPNKTAFVQSTVTIPAGVNAVGEYGTSILVTNANIKIFTLSVGAGPTIEGLWFKGSLPAGSAGDSAFSSQMGIFYTGDPSNRVTDVTVRRCKFDNFHGVGVQIIHGQDIHVERCLLNQYAAGGVWFTSVIRGSCHRNTFIGTGQLYLTTTFCYAFTATTQITTTGGNAGLVTDSINPKSRNIEVTDNLVTNQAWECLDTHLGDQITFSRNQCYGPGAGIAVVGNDNAPMFSPVNITITDNIVKCDLTAASNGGIALIGAKYDATANGGTGNAARERVTGTVSGNRLYGCMIDDQTSSGAVNVSHSTGVTVVGNTLEACRSIGFYIRDAQDTTLIGNTVIDLWRTSAASQAFYVLKDDVNFTIDMIGNVMGTNGLSKPNINTTAVGGTSDAGIVLRMTSNRLTGAVNSTMTKVILAPPLFTKMASDSTPVNNSTTLAASPLVIAMEASSTYEMTAFVAYNSTTTADMIIGWTVPTGASMSWMLDSLFISSTSAAGQVYRALANAAQTGIAAGAGATNVVAQPMGTVTTGSTAGNLTLTFAQNVAEVSDTKILAGSWLRLTKVA